MPPGTWKLTASLRRKSSRKQATRRTGLCSGWRRAACRRMRRRRSCTRTMLRDWPFLVRTRKSRGSGPRGRRARGHNRRCRTDGGVYQCGCGGDELSRRLFHSLGALAANERLRCKSFETGYGAPGLLEGRRKPGSGNACGPHGLHGSTKRRTVVAQMVRHLPPHHYLSHHCLDSNVFSE